MGFSMPRVSNDNPDSETLLCTIQYRPDDPYKPFTSKKQNCLWFADHVDWYTHKPRHSDIKFVTPHQRYNGEALEICQHRSRVDAQARALNPRRFNPRRWTRSPRCWRQPEVAWINLPLKAADPETFTFTFTFTFTLALALALALAADQRQRYHRSWQSPGQHSRCH